VLTALKKSEDGDSLILRFYEWAGKKTEARIAVPAGASEAVETDLMEHDLKVAGARLTLHDGQAGESQVGFEVEPFSINTVRIGYHVRGEGFWQAQR
jgi:alpha-mannosidase